MKTIDIKTMSVSELKALAYDILASLNRDQKTLQMVEKEISIKNASEAKEATVEDKKE